MKNKKCLKCQNINSTEANFCRMCGVELTNDDSFVITNDDSNENKMKCPYCNHENPSNVTVCTCGYKLKGYVESKNPTSAANSNSKYYALQIVSSILTFIGYISIVVGVIWFIYSLSNNPFESTMLKAAIILSPTILPIIGGIINIALSQLINLFINIADDVNKIKNKDK